MLRNTSGAFERVRTATRQDLVTGTSARHVHLPPVGQGCCEALKVAQPHSSVYWLR